MLRPGLISRHGGQVVEGGSFFPDDIAGLQVWLKDTGLAGVDGDPISTWTNEGAAGNFTQATSASRPTKKTAILNGIDCARFDDVDDWLDGGDLSAAFPTAATLFVVATVNTDSNYAIYENVSGNNGFWRFTGNGDGYFHVFRSSRINQYPATQPSTGTHYTTVVSSASAYTVYQDGVSAGAQAAAYAAGTAHEISRFSGGFFGGDLFEVIAYDSALSSGDLTSVHGYLTARFGL